MINTQILGTGLLALLGAYFLGSVPTALIISRIVAGVDIREIGDGNMGARNVTRTLGWKPGAVVAAVDFSKGALAVSLARAFHLSLGWQVVAGAFAVLGHDFPLWAGLRGGQGMAAILGALGVLMPLETAVGLIGFATAYLLMRNFDPSAAVGLGLLALMAWQQEQPPLLLGSTILLFLSIPAKKAMDWPRRRQLHKMSSSSPAAEESNQVLPRNSS